MTVIQFPNQAKPTPEEVFEPDPLSTIDVAFEVHRMIFNGLRMESLRDHLDIFNTLLAVSIAKHFGPDWSHWVELQFEHVYGMDPYTFIEHVSSYRV